MINTGILKASRDFQGFMDEVTTRRDEAFEAFRTAKQEDLLRYQQRYNAFQEVAEILDQIEAEQKSGVHGEEED